MNCLGSRSAATFSPSRSPDVECIEDIDIIMSLEDEENEKMRLAKLGV
jgi:hypothetical protein